MTPSDPDLDPNLDSARPTLPDSAVPLENVDPADVYANQKRLPSPPWYGALITVGGLGLMALILLTYTLLDWDWQQRLGGWNYVVTIALIPIVSVLMRRWQPDENL